MIHFHIITLFSESIDGYVRSSIVGRALRKGYIKISYYNPRDFTSDKHKRVDRRPYGGGPGMVLEAESILRAVKAAIGRKKSVSIFFFSPSGKQFDSAMATRLSKGTKHIVFVAGHYEGVDARVKKVLNAKEISIGPYILTGGELPAAVLIDAIARHVPNVLGNNSSLEEERIASRDVYTRPEILRWGGKNYRVPKVLLSGHHEKIEKWRHKKK